MKTTFIARAVAAIVAFPILILFQAPNGTASRGIDVGGESLAVTSCTDNAVVFPALIHTRLKTDLNGSFSGIEIHLSDENGDCPAALYSSNTEESSISYRQDDNDMVAVWN